MLLDAREPNLAAAFRRLQIDVLIHTAGLFQGQDYAVARAAIEARCHYIDLADSRKLVAAISSAPALQRPVSRSSAARAVLADIETARIREDSGTETSDSEMHHLTELKTGLQIGQLVILSNFSAPRWCEVGNAGR